MISKEFPNIRRSEPNVHEVDGACLWTSVILESLGKAPKHRPEVHRRTVVGTVEIGMEDIF